MGGNNQDGDVFIADHGGTTQIALRTESQSIVLGAFRAADANGCYYANLGRFDADEGDGDDPQLERWQPALK